MSTRAIILAMAGLVLAASAVNAQAPAKAKPAANQAGGFAGLGSNSKEPIKIDSDRLDVFDKDKKAVFSGNVVAVQGETTMRCSALTVFYEQSAGAQAGGKKAQAATPTAGAAPAAGMGGAENGVRKLECGGPVTVISRDQVATADNAIYDKAANKVFLTGNAKLSQGQNVTTGDRVIYDLTTSQATVETKPGARVKALLVPGSDQPAAPGGPNAGQSAAQNQKKPGGKGAATN